MFTCEKCGYKTTIQCNFKRHLARKVPCKRDPNAPPPVHKCHECDREFQWKYQLEKHRCKGDSVIRCDACKKTFTTYAGKSRHKKHSCKGVPPNNQLTPARTAPVIINNNNTTINVYNNNINVIPFDDIIRDISVGDYTRHISPESFAKAIRDSDDIIKTIFLELFLNPKCPERHALFLTNKRDGPCYTVDNMGNGTDVKYLRQRPINQVTEKVIDGVSTLVDINMDDVDHGAPDKKISHHQKTIYTAGNYRPTVDDIDMEGLPAREQQRRIQEWTDDHKNAVKGYTSDITSALVCMRDMVRRTQRKDPSIQTR